jgi:uncharacterized phage protein (TIGR01671 family)
MREIKFRLWNVDDKIMKFWGDCDFQIYPSGEMDCDGLSIGETVDDTWRIMQFTGLKDKNGKEIYEGDILKDGKGQYGQVLWHRNSFLVEWTERNYDGSRQVEPMIDDCFNYGEVVGNLYETPELLTLNK